ncbi:chromate transporter [Lyngbya aestuarii]|uniref:chromate transporter n=1 Tax=Lyngbya aestuarii TaxID=118322 RepID=UPI00403E3064
MNSQQKISYSPLSALIIIFAKVGAMAFGGAVSAYLLHHLLKHGMLTEKEYLEVLNWCQSLPGPLATNLSAYLGWHFNGAWGAFLATVALLLPGASVIMLVSQVISEAPEQQVFQGILSSVAAAAVGLIAGMTWLLARRLDDRSWLLVAAIIFVLVGILKIAVPLAILFVAPLLWWLVKKKGEDNESST